MKKKILIAMLTVFATFCFVFAGCEGGSKTYTATFYSNGGTRVPSKQCKVIEEEPATTREGYLFDGWFLTEDFQDGGVSYPFTLTKDTNFYAKWTPVNENAHVVTFIVNGGLPVSPMTVAVINSEPKTERSGYLFRGWFTNENLTGNRITFPYTVTEDTTLYAKWEPTENLEFTVTFNSNGGSNIPAVTDKAGNSIAAEPIPTKQNAEFAGWFDNEGLLGKRVTFPYEIINDVTLYARWNVNQTITDEEIATLQGYFNDNGELFEPFNFSTNYLMDIKYISNENVTSTVYKAASNYMFDGTTVYGRSPYFDDDAGDWIRDTNGNIYYFKDFAFYRADTEEYMGYFEEVTGDYMYDGLYYSAETISNLEEYFYMTYLDKIANLDPSKFYFYENKWWAVDDYAATAGALILGNTASGDMQSYTSFALTFNARGVLTDVYAQSQITHREPISGGNGYGVTYYYTEHTIAVNNIQNIGNMPVEDDFSTNGEKPSGLYPTLNPNDNKRNNVTGDGVAYTNAQLQTAFDGMNNFTAYYTFAGNTFSGMVYQPSTVYHNANKGKVVIDNYSYTLGGQTVEQVKQDDRFYFYDENTKAFFLAVKTSGGYQVFCDQYSYKNNYDYNQYLLGTDSVISYNCKVPTASLKLDATSFAYNEKIGCFEYVDNYTLTEVGRSIFGDMDFTYPEASEVETYKYLRVYVNGGKIVKILAATQLEIGGSSYEFFMKEIVILDYNTTEVTLPSGVTFIAPGEAKENGSVDGLAAAITKMGLNYIYTDQFVADDSDELFGLYGGNGDETFDRYVYTANAATIGSDNTVFYYKEGIPYVYSRSSRAEYNVYETWNALNSNYYISWGTPIASMLNANWFYEGKDGKYYGKADNMEDIAEVVARYSGSDFYFNQISSLPMSKSYYWKVVLDYVAIELDTDGRLNNIYYSGCIRVISMGTHDKPFSGRGVFSAIGAASISIPSGVTPDSSIPAVVKKTIVADYSFDVKNGRLDLAAVRHATSYKAYIYDLNNNLLDGYPKTVEDGTNLKDSAFGLIKADEPESEYYLAIQAVGDSNWNDAEISEKLRFSITALEKPEAPVLTVDRNAKTVGVGEVQYAFGYHITVTSGNTEYVNTDIDNTNRVYDLSTLTAGRTYTIKIYAKGDNKVSVNGEVATCLYSPHQNGSYVGDFITAISGNTSFAASYGTGLKISEGSWTAFDLSFYYYFDLQASKGGILVKQIKPNADRDIPRNVVLQTVIYFDISGDKLVGTKEVKEFGSVTYSGDFQMDIPFKALAGISESEFEEISGDITKYNGLTYKLKNIDNYQDVLKKASLLEELFDKTFTYKELTFSVAYNGNSSTGYVPENGLSHECKLNFTALGEDGLTYNFNMSLKNFGQANLASNLTSSTYFPKI